MKKKVILFFLLIIFLNITFVIPQENPDNFLGTFPQNSAIQLHQTCSNCTFVNLTSVKYPNSLLEILNTNMENRGEDYNITFVNTSQQGFYIYNTCGDKDGPLSCENIRFEINRAGKTLTEAEARMYTLTTTGIFLLFLLSLIFTFKLPFKDNLDHKGNIIFIPKTKYLKVGMIGITYALFIWFLNFLIGLTNNFINLSMYFGFVSFMFELLLKISYPLFIVIFVWFLFTIIRDLNIKSNIKKWGFSPK